MSASRRAARRAARSARPAPPPSRTLPVRQIAIGAVVIVALLLVGAAFVGSATGKSYTCASLAPVPSGSLGPEGAPFPDLGRQHVPPGSTIHYPLCPPASGPHYSAAGVGPIRPGFYGPDDDVSPGGWVHNLEHGFIVVLYRGGESAPDPATLASIEQLVADGPTTPTAAACGYRTKMLAARFDDMATPFAVLAWNRWLPLSEWDPAAARSFAETWIERNAPEPNAC